MREIKERRDSGDEGRYVPDEFSRKSFFSKRLTEVIFILLLIGGVVAVRSLGPDNEAADEMRESIESLITWQPLQWEKDYPHGYKIIAFTDKDIITTSHDTLPEELKINWKRMSVARIEANQLKRTLEKIEIKINNINYAPAGIKGDNVKTTITRHTGSTGFLGQYGNLKLYVKIINDDGANLFCIFGLK